MSGDTCRDPRTVNARPTRPVVTWGAVAFLVCLIGFGVISWLIRRPGIPPIDAAFTDFLHGLANPILDALMIVITTLGSSVVLGMVVGLAAVLLVRRRRPEALFTVVAFVGTLVLNDTFKLLYQRPRPGFDWAEVWPATGFPSGHAMNSFVTYVALALVIRRVGGRRAGIFALVLAILLAGGVGISRVYLGAHWLSDVIGGYLAGALWLLCLVAASVVVSRLLRRPDSMLWVVGVSAGPDHVDRHAELGPPSVRGQDAGRTVNDRGRDDEGVRKTDAGPMASSQLGRSPRNDPGRGLDGRREGIDERIDRVALSTAPTQGRHEDLGVR